MKTDPTKAREAYLDTLDPTEQARVIRTAEKFGPAATDADWLIAYAAERAATRIEAATRAARSTAVRAPAGGLAAFGLALAAFAGIAWVSGHWSVFRSPSLVMYAAAIGLGVLGAAAFVALTARRST
ncbi:MAG: hypothetical protein NVSMB19_26370 [Vulcanimicrobiaceae bacterium]